MDRRAVLATFGGFGLLSAGGCVDFISGRGPQEFEAAPLSVSDAVLENTGYSFVELDTVTLDREFEAGGRTRDVRVLNYQSEYEKAVVAGPFGPVQAAVFTALSTPSVSVLGREFNPVGNMDTEEFAEMVQNRYDEIESVSHVADELITIGGQETTLTKFVAAGRLLGQFISIELLITKAVIVGDHLAVTVGAYPEITPGEREYIQRMMEAVRPAE